MTKAKQKKKTRNEVHVVPTVDGWAIKLADATFPEATFDLKSSAMWFGRDLAKQLKAELFEHTRSGKITRRDSYGGDPKRRKG